MNKFDINRILSPFNLIIVAIAATALYAAYTAYNNWSTLNEMSRVAKGHRIQVADDQSANLQVTLFYDYQCIFCAQIDPIVREAAKKDGEVELLFKFLPFLGERSEDMARMAFAAGQQGKFLEAHDYLLHGGNRTYDEEEIRNMTTKLGLDYDKFIKDMNSKAAKQKIDENMNLAMSLGIYSTPTLYMARGFFVPEGGMPDVNKIRELFDEARQRL